MIVGNARTEEEAIPETKNSGDWKTVRKNDRRHHLEGVFGVIGLNLYGIRSANKRPPELTPAEPSFSAATR